MSEICFWPAVSGLKNAPKVFISYQHEYQDLVETMRNLLPRYAVVAMYHDTIPAGAEWSAGITQEIEESFAAICLMTREFFSSAYITGVEIPQMVRRHDTDSGKGFRLLPLLVTDCYDLFEHSALGKLQAVNKPKQWYDQIRAPRADIEKDLQAAVDRAFSEWNQAARLSGPAAAQWGIDPPTQTFVGRARERQGLQNHIRQGGFVVVSGSPRPGRRTLVRRVAYDLREAGDLPGSGVWVDCRNIATYDDLVLKVASVVLRGREQPDPGACNRILREQFRQERMLVVLDATGNPDRDGTIARWGQEMPAPSCAVYIPRDEFRTPRTVTLAPDLDPGDAAELFRQRACIANGKADFRDPESRKLIAGICQPLRFHPLFIEMFAERCGEDLLVDILAAAKDKAGTTFELLWGDELAKRFLELTEAHKRAFLLLSRVPGAICHQVVTEVTGLSTAELGKALKHQFLWSPGAYSRYYIDEYVRDFATRQLAEKELLPDAERQAAAGFGRAAAGQAAQIDKGRLEGQYIAEAAFDWFELEWQNVIWCDRTARKYSDNETVCRLADSLILFMLNRGHLAECRGIYERVERLRRKEAESGGREARLALARTLNDKAVCLQYLHDFAAAQQAITECIDIRAQELAAAADATGRIKGMFRLAQSRNSCGAIYEEWAVSLRSRRRQAMSAESRQRALELLHQAADAYEEAKRICTEARDLCEPESEDGQELAIELSQTLSNVGQCNARLFRVLGSDPQLAGDRSARGDMAERAFSESLDIPRPDDWRESQTRSRQAWYYAEAGEYRPARDLYEMALAGLKKNPFEEGQALRGLARVLLQFDPADTAAAFAVFGQARDVFGVAYPAQWTEVSLDMAEAEKRRGRAQEARERADEALKFALEHRLETERMAIRDFIRDVLGDDDA
jgi:hypothetical protein